MADQWDRIVKLRQQAFSQKPSAHTRASPNARSSRSSAERDEVRLWAAIDRLEAALDKLVTEMEKLMSVRQSGEKK